MQEKAMSNANPNTCDVLVIGGGMMGVCAAYYLAAKGCRVRLVEKGEIGSGCSYANAGLVIPGHSMPLATPGIIAKGIRWMLNPESPFYVKIRWDRELLDWMLKFWRACRAEKMRESMAYLCAMNLASLHLFEELHDQEGVDYFFERKGLLVVCRTKSNMDAAIQEVKDKEKLKVEAKILNKEQLRHLEPSLGNTVIGGVHFPQDAHINSYEFIRKLAEQAREKGCELMSGTEVIGWETGDGKIKTVITTRGDMKAEQIVLATGAWSAKLIKELRLKLPVQPAKGYSFSYRRPRNSPRIPLILSETKVAVTPLKDVLRFGGTLELAGMDFRINRRRVAAILKAVPAYLADMKIEQMELLELWRGCRPCSPDGVPIIGRYGAYDNLIIATGHAMQGVSLGPVTGKLISQMVMDEKPLIDMKPLSPERFH